VQPENVSDTVSVYGHIKGRPDVQEPDGKEGVDSILGQMFSYGSEDLNRIAFQEALDSIGADESGGRDFSVQVLRKDFERGVELLADNELHPALPARPFEILRTQLAHIVTVRNKSPNHLSSQSLRRALFPKTDPSLREATAKSVSSLTLDDVKSYYRRVFRPDLTTIVVIGKITPEQAMKTIQKYFGDWKAEGPKPPTDLPAAPPNKATVVAVPDKTRVQDNVLLGETLPLTRDNPDYYPLQLGNAVLGGGFYSARLSVALRKKTGLVYSVGSFLQSGPNRSAYLIEYASDPQNVDKAAGIVQQELKGMRTTSVPPDELDRVKAMLLRQIPLGESSVNAIARGFISRTDLGLSLDEPVIAARRYIALSPQDVRAAFHKWIRPEDLARVTQGPVPP
jgi:zinc protease